MSLLKSNLSNLNSLFVVGPTGSGKSSLAMQVAREFGGEIVCADSQTIRKSLDIGTAKPSKIDQAEIPHHMLDIIEPYADFSVAEYVRQAEKILSDIYARGKLAIVVGGTGLYIDALLYGFRFRPTVSKYSRSELEELNVMELQEVIKTTGLLLPGNAKNKRHLIRTIETDGKPSERSALRAGAHVIGIDPGAEIGEDRIAKRLEQIFESGFIPELNSIFEKYGPPPKKIDAIAYNIAFENRNNWGEYDIDKIKNDVFIAERQYAKRQRSWFKRNADIVWFNSSEQAYEHIKKMID